MIMMMMMMMMMPSQGFQVGGILPQHRVDEPGRRTAEPSGDNTSGPPVPRSPPPSSRT